MNTTNSNNTLNDVRISRSINEYRSYFYELLEHDHQRALNLINDESLNFTSLFLIKSIIKEPDFLNALSQRNKIALSIINELDTDNRNESRLNDFPLNYIQLVHSTLKWVVASGALNDGLNDEYDEILDKAAISLIKIYRDKTILPDIADIIFKRYERGFYINDLVWHFLKAVISIV